MKITQAYLRQIIKEETNLLLKEETEFKNIMLDIAGLIPGVGEVADLANAVDYAKKGDYLFSGLSLISMIPEVGDVIGKGGKISIWVTKAFPKGAKFFVKHAPKVAKAKKAIKASKPVIDEILEKLEEAETDNKKIKTIQKHLPKIREALKAFAGSTSEKLNKDDE